MTWMCSNTRRSKKTSSNEFGLVLNIWKMGRRWEQQWTVVTNMPSWPGIYFRDHFLVAFLGPAVLFCWMAVAQVEKQFPLTQFRGLWQIFLVNASRELPPRSQSSSCVGIPVDENFPVSASHSLGLIFPRKHRAVSSLLWNCMSKSAMPGELHCLME